jgi:heat shock protein HslJ
MDVTPRSRKIAAAMATGALVSGIATGAGQVPIATAPGADEVANMTYHGIEEAGGTVTLQGGSWEGAPYAEGGASRPRVAIVPGPLTSGDLDGDGSTEALVLLASSSGGSGTHSSVAVVSRRDGRVQNLATRLLGDRVQVRSMTIKDGRLTIDVVRAGPDDPACCPGEMATYTWALDAGGLVDASPVVVTGRLSAGTLEGTGWELRRWAFEEEAPASPVVTLAFADGQVHGNAGCNGYFAGITDMAGEAAGSVRLGPVGATRKMCGEAEMAVEDRYLRQLGEVSRFGFMNGRLMLDYAGGIMLFDRTGGPEQNAAPGKLP